MSSEPEHDAARQLLAESHLRVNLDDYALDPGDECGFDWPRLMRERGFSGGESALIALAQSISCGVLGQARGLDDENWSALLRALATLRS